MYNYYGKRDRDRPYRAVYEYGGFRGTLVDIAEHYGIKLSTFRTRVSLGWDIGEAVERGISEAAKKGVQKMANATKINNAFSAIISDADFMADVKNINECVKERVPSETICLTISVLDKLLMNHKREVLELVSAITEKPVRQIKKQRTAETVIQVIQALSAKEQAV